MIIHASLLLVAIAWASNFVGMKYLLGTLEPGSMVFMRLVIASLVFAPIVLFVSGGWPRIARSDLKQLVLIAFLGITVNTSAVAFGTQLIPAAVASLIVTSNPIFTAIISRFINGEPLTRRKLVGVAIAFTGFLVVLLYGGQEAEISVQNITGVMITLGGPMAFAFYTVLSKPMVARYHPIQFVGVTTIVGTLPLFIFPIFDPGLFGTVADFNPTQWMAMLIISVFSLVIAYILWYRGLTLLDPTQIAVYIYLVPVFGAIGARLFLGEQITIFVLLGGLTILTGVIITNTTRRGPIDWWRNRRRRRVITTVN